MLALPLRGVLRPLRPAESRLPAGRSREPGSCGSSVGELSGASSPPAEADFPLEHSSLKANRFCFSAGFSPKLCFPPGLSLCPRALNKAAPALRVVWQGGMGTVRPYNFMITTFMSVSCARLSFLPHSDTAEKFLKVSSRRAKQTHVAIPQVIPCKTLQEVPVLCKEHVWSFWSRAGVLGFSTWENAVHLY